MIWSHLLQLLVWCSPMVVLSLRPALRVAADRRPAMRTPSRRYAADDGDEKIINYEDLPELGACEPKKHKDPASKDGEALTDRFLMAARAGVADTCLREIICLALAPSARQLICRPA